MIEADILGEVLGCERLVSGGIAEQERHLPIALAPVLAKIVAKSERGSNGYNSR